MAHSNMFGLLNSLRESLAPVMEVAEANLRESVRGMSQRDAEVHIGEELVVLITRIFGVSDEEALRTVEDVCAIEDAQQRLAALIDQHSLHMAIEIAGVSADVRQSVIGST